MKYLLPIFVMVSLAHSTPKAPVYWNYPGPNGDKIRAALAVERTDEHAHHLILPDELDAYLSDIPLPERFDCLDDSKVCESEAQGVLRLLGFGARVDADSRRTDQGYEVTLEMTLADGVDKKILQRKRQYHRRRILGCIRGPYRTGNTASRSKPKNGLISNRRKTLWPRQRKILDSCG